MKDEELKSKLQDYVAWAHLWHYLEASHTRKELNDLLGKQLEMEIEILGHFGMPHTLYYSELFQFLGLRKKFKLKHIDKFLKDLKAEADKYHSGPIFSDLKLLELAQAHQLDIEEVLPELTLRLQPEPYYCYLYFSQLLAGIASAGDILQELNIIQENDLSLKLNLLSQDKGLLDTLEYQKLFEFNLKFIKLFLSEFEQTFDQLDYLNSVQKILRK